MYSTSLRHLTLIAGSISLISLSNLCSARSSQAAIINGSFETGDTTGWTTIGNSPVETGYGATEGIYSIQPSTVEFFPGRSPAVPASNIETFLGLPSDSLSSIGHGTAIRGSALKQTFTANARDVLLFDWNFGTLENISEPDVNDFAFVTLSSDNKLGSNNLDILANTKYQNFMPLIIPDVGEGQQTGFNTFSFTIPDTTTYTLGIGLVKVGNGSGDSGLFIDNVKLTTTDVPEPSSTFGTLTFGALMAVILLKSEWRRKC